MAGVAPRTCGSCGADVSTAGSFCPKCGADLEARLIELGGGTPARARRKPPKDRPRRTKLLAGVAAVVVGGLAVTSLVGDDGGEDDDPTDESGSGDATTTTLADLSDRAPLLGEETGMVVVIQGQSRILVDLDDGGVTEVGPFDPADAADETFVSAGDLGVQVWRAPYTESAAFLVDEIGADSALLGDTVAWAFADGEARALALDQSGVLVRLPLPSGAVPVGTLGDTLVVAAPGGTFAIGTDGSTGLRSAGTPIAAEHGLLALTTCDDALACVVETVDADGALLQTVPLTGTGAVTDAAVGPDGQVAWISGVPGNGSVFVDGTERFPLPSAAATTLAWSPDGRWLVGSFGRNDIWVLDATAGSDAEPVVVDLGRNVYPETVLVLDE